VVVALLDTGGCGSGAKIGGGGCEDNINGTDGDDDVAAVLDTDGCGSGAEAGGGSEDNVNGKGGSGSAGGSDGGSILPYSVLD